MSDQLYDFEDRADRLDMISRLAGTPAVRAAHREVVELKKEEEAKLGRSLLENPQPVNQRLVDYNRGFWRGLLFAYTLFLTNSGSKLRKLVAQELEESEG